MKLFKWHEFAILYNDGDWAKGLGEGIINNSKKYDIKVVNPESTRIYLLNNITNNNF